MLTEQAIERRFPGLPNYLFLSDGLSEEERYWVQRELGENTDEIFFVRRSLNENKKWALPVEIREPCSVGLNSGEEYVLHLGVVANGIRIISQKGKRFNVEQIEASLVVFSETDKSFNVYLSDDLSVRKIPAERIFLKEEIERMKHERKISIVVGRAGDSNAKNDSGVLLYQMMCRSKVFSRALMNLSMLLPVEKVVDSF